MRVKSASGQKTRDFELEVKAIGEGDDGKFAGYASVWDVVDSQKEVVSRGAFQDSLERIKALGRKLPVLWQHRQGEPIGVYDRVEEDSKGLYVEGRLLYKAVSRASEAYALLKEGAISGLSIGYYVVKESVDRDLKAVRLDVVDLKEVSLVTMPALDVARVEVVKSEEALRTVQDAFLEGRVPSLKEFDAFLREVAKASKSQATAITNRGLSHLLRGEPEGEAVKSRKPDLSDLKAALAGFSLPPIR